MEDNKSLKEPEKEKDSWGMWLYKQVAGTAAMTAVMSAGGAVFGAVKKTGVKEGAKWGAGLGFITSLGFGKILYEELENIFGKNKQSENSTQSPQLKTSTDKLEMAENPNAKGGHAEKILAEKNQQKSLQV